MNLKQGRSLQNGKYRIDIVLGQGGFGITYLATQELLDRKVCIKEFFFKDSCSRNPSGEITLGTAGNKDLVERFLNKFIKEARTLSQLDHPKISRVLDIFKENTTAYYVMDYIEGSSLESIINSKGALTESVASDYIRQVANALDYIHQRSINHLDVKPANIMLRRSDNKAILIDFGVSKQYDSAGEQTSTTPVGISYGYAPIEQYRPGGVTSFSPQADIYALGATLFRLVTGKIPPQAVEIFSDGLTGLPQSLSSNIADAIRKAMQLKRDDRPQSIKDFLNILYNATSPNAPSYASSHTYRQANETTKIIEPIQVKNEINGHEYVDLGLPSGLKWATCNIGANTPEDYGDYFAWGEIKSKDKYTLSNYKIRLGIRKNEISGTQYDAARIKWGARWRMPTKIELQELINNCIRSRTTINGKDGYKITGPNGNSIFLPAAGYKGEELLEKAAKGGYYLSATPTNLLNAFTLSFYFKNDYWDLGNACRDCGYTIRPVSD